MLKPLRVPIRWPYSAPHIVCETTSRTSSYRRRVRKRRKDCENLSTADPIRLHIHITPFLLSRCWAETADPLIVKFRSCAKRNFLAKQLPFTLVSLNRLSVGCGTTPRRLSGQSASQSEDRRNRHLEDCRPS